MIQAGKRLHTKISHSVYSEGGSIRNGVEKNASGTIVKQNMTHPTLVLLTVQRLLGFLVTVFKPSGPTIRRVPNFFT